MWKEELQALKFPFAVNSEECAENILFKSSPERMVLLQWVFTLTSGLLNEILPKDLAEYFHNLGIVEGDSIKFVEGNSTVSHQKKVWDNLFQFARRMEYSPEVSLSFFDNYCNRMPSYYISDEHLSTTETLDSLLLDPGIPNLDNIIAVLKEHVAKPVVTSTEENKIILCKLEELLNKLSLINAQIRSPELVIVEKQNDFGNSIANLSKTLEILETVLMSSSMFMSSMKELEKNLDEHLLKSDDILELANKLKRSSTDI